MAYNYDDEYELTPEQKELLRKANEDQGFGENVGGIVGTVAGGALGVIPTVLTGGAAAASIPALAALGGAAGRGVGGWIGGNSANAAEEELTKQLQEQRKGEIEKLARRRLFQELRGDFLPNVPGL